MATDRRNPSGSGRGVSASGITDGHPPLERGELMTLLQRLRVDLDAFLDDLGVDRESSGNRESSRRL
jgi:hypothetical protein